MNEDESEFHALADRAASQKGDEWFNAWSESNPIDNYMIHHSDDELARLIEDASEGGNICLVDYKAMTRKLASDMRGN